MGRRRRKRGTKNGSLRGLGRDEVPVLIARNRVGESRAVVLDVANARTLTHALGPIVAPGATLCTDGSGALRAAAQELHLKHVAQVTKRGQRTRGIYHIQTVNAHMSRLKTFPATFRGVATKYLHRSLLWFAFYERVGNLSRAAARRVLLGNTAALEAVQCCPHRYRPCRMIHRGATTSHRVHPMQRSPMPSRATRKGPWVAFGATLLVGLALVCPFVRLVASYWAFFAMGTAGGNGMVLAYLVAPLGALIAVLAGCGAYRAAASERLGPARAIGLGVAGVVAAVALLFTFEAWRTADDPTESGEPVSAVAFLRSCTGR